MTIGTIIAGLGAIWLAAALATFAASLFGALLQPRLQRARATSPETPPVSLLLPVKLLNPGFERAQASVFGQDYPDYEVLVGSMESRSAALVTMRTLSDQAARPARFVTSIPGGAVSPKLDTLAGPLAEAAHEVIATKDSNITYAPETLRSLLRSLTPGVGLVCAVPVAVRPEGLAGKVEAILINRDARLLLTASATGKGYGVGKTTLFRKADFARIGGVAAIGYTIAEDTALARAFERIGLKTAFADASVAQEIGAPTLADVYGRQARWAVIRRAEEPLTFVFEPIACPFPAALAAALAAPLVSIPGLAAFGLILLGWYALEVLVAALKLWEVRPWTPLAFLGRDAVLLTAWARAWTTREVTWAGTKQDVRSAMGRKVR